MTENDKNIKIPHHRSPNFISEHATGVVLAGPSPDGLHHLIFYVDAIGIQSETGESIGENRYVTSIDPEDVLNFREDKARISLPTETLMRLYGMLHDRYGVKEEQAKDDKSKKN